MAPLDQAALPELLPVALRKPGAHPVVIICELSGIPDSTHHPGRAVIRDEPRAGVSCRGGRADGPG